MFQHPPVSRACARLGIYSCLRSRTRASTAMYRTAPVSPLHRTARRLQALHPQGGREVRDETVFDSPIKAPLGTVLQIDGLVDTEGEVFET